MVHKLVAGGQVGEHVLVEVVVEGSDVRVDAGELLLLF